LEPIIDLAPGAEDNALALQYAESLRDNLRRDSARLRSFRALRGAIQVVPFDTGDALTLRFDLGRLTIHDGHVGIPSVTIGGPLAALARLDELPMRKRVPLPWPRLRDASGRKLAAELGRQWLGGDIKIYGLWSHPRMVARFLRILSRAGDPC
jgi:hypothetical protein